MRRTIVFVMLMLALATLACALSGGDDEKPTPIPVKTLTPTSSVFLTATPTATLIPTATQVQSSGVQPIIENCVPRTDWPLYTVVAGDTLGVLAERTGTSYQYLVTANCLADANTIYVGQPLRVPALPPTNTPQVENAPQFNQSLTASPAIAGEGGVVTTQPNIILDAGPVTDASKVDFYARVTIDEANPTLIGSDTNLADGAKVNFVFQSTGEVYYFQAIAENEAGTASSSLLLVKYDPAFGSEPEGDAPAINQALDVQPITATEDGIVTAQAEITLDIGEVPDADQVRYYASTASDGSDSFLIGQDLDPYDGTRIVYTFPATDDRLYFWAEASNEFGATVSSSVFVIYDPTISP